MNSSKLRQDNAVFPDELLAFLKPKTEPMAIAFDVDTQLARFNLSSDTVQTAKSRVLKMCQDRNRIERFRVAMQYTYAADNFFKSALDNLLYFSLAADLESVFQDLIKPTRTQQGNKFSYLPYCLLACASDSLDCFKWLVSEYQHEQPTQAFGLTGNHTFEIELLETAAACPNQRVYTFLREAFQYNLTPTEEGIIDSYIEMGKPIREK